MWSRIASRRRMSSFFEKLKFQRYKTHHTNKPKKVIKKAEHVVAQALIEHMAMKIDNVQKANQVSVQDPI